jgi:hypothetical protein
MMEETTWTGLEICVPVLHLNELLEKNPEPNIVTVA